MAPKLFAGIGSTPESARAAIGALGADDFSATIAGGIGDFVFSDFGAQDPAQGRYTSWSDLMAKLATLQFGAAPTVRLALTTGPFTVPSVGMPVNGWDFRGGRLTSFYGATGAVQVIVPAGVMFDNLFAIGGALLGDGAVVLKIDPPAGTNVLNFSALFAPGSAWIHVIGGGSLVDHSTNVGAYMKGPDASVTMVLVASGSQQNTGLAPPLTGPLLELGSTDGAVGVQYWTGGLPDGWLVGGGVGSTLLSIHDTAANPNTGNPGVWVPGFTGGGGVLEFNYDLSKFLRYQAGNPADWVGAPPTDVQSALDRISAAVAGLLGGPIP
jgi:hypothetical protein